MYELGLRYAWLLTRRLLWLGAWCGGSALSLAGERRRRLARGACPHRGRAQLDAVGHHDTPLFEMNHRRRVTCQSSTCQRSADMNLTSSKFTKAGTVSHGSSDTFRAIFPGAGKDGKDLKIKKTAQHWYDHLKERPTCDPPPEVVQALAATREESRCASPRCHQCYLL